MLKVYDMGNINGLAVPIGAILVDMENWGLCCTSPFVCVALVEEADSVGKGLVSANQLTNLLVKPAQVSLVVNISASSKSQDSRIQMYLASVSTYHLSPGSTTQQRH